MLANCPSCGSENAAHRRYCRKCGRTMGASCPTCQFFNLSGDAFCGGCGIELRKVEEIQGAPSAAEVPLADDMGLGEEDFQDLLREHPSTAKTPHSPSLEDPPIESFFGESNDS